MKTWFLWMACTLSMSTITLAQSVAPRIDDIQPRTAKATGNTTGHIANLTLGNASDTDITFPGGPMMIPSDGQYQPYIVPSIGPVKVPAGKEVTIPLQGFCLDVYKPAAPKGHTMYPTSDLNPADMSFIEHLDRIHTALIEVKNISGYTTPFSGNPEKERESVIQQTFWIYTSTLSGKPYGYKELCENVEQQFETHYQNEIPPIHLDDEISALWNFIVEVGTKAGIPAFLPAPLPHEGEITEKMPVPEFPDIIDMITAKGTGRTTGHIATLTITNPTDRPIHVHLGPSPEILDGRYMKKDEPLFNCPSLFIPSDGRYQPYIVPSFTPVIVPPNEKGFIDVQGFCVDIHLPPVPAGSDMPAVTEWVTVPQAMKPVLGVEPPGFARYTESFGDVPIMVVPTKLSLPLDKAVEIVINARPEVIKQIVPNAATDPSPSGSATGDCIPLNDGYQATIPGTDKPLNVSVDPDKNPSVAVPLLLDAINRISMSYDELQSKGVISTPFSGNPEKEREAVIQQTFWMYASALSDSKYGKDDFKGQTVKQFETNTGKPFSTVPQPQQDNINKGVDDFWDTFEAVGVEAKILSKPVDTPKILLPEEKKFWDSYSTNQAKVL